MKGSDINSLKFKFTLVRLNALPAVGKRYTVKDTETPYLQCRVSAAGKRTLQVYRRPREGKSPVRIKIRNTASMQQIRAEADGINAELSAGINPNQQKKHDALLGITLEDAFDQYTAAKSLSPATLASYQKALDRMEGWKSKPMHSISRSMLLELYNQLAEESHSAAMKVPQVLRAVWNFTNDLTDDDAFGRSPTIILNKQKKRWSRTNARNRKISLDQLPGWLCAVRNLPCHDGHSKRMAAYLEFLLLTGLRRREAGYMRWEDVNLKAGYFIVRRTKNHRDHCLPVTVRTRQLLHSMRDNGELVFGVEEPKKAIKKVVAVSGVQFSCHDLRRSFATFADRSGAGSYIIKAILNHSSSNDVTGAHYAGYNPLDNSGNIDMDEVRALKESMQSIEDFILVKAKVPAINTLKSVG